MCIGLHTWVWRFSDMTQLSCGGNDTISVHPRNAGWYRVSFGDQSGARQARKQLRLAAEQSLSILVYVTHGPRRLHEKG